MSYKDTVLEGYDPPLVYTIGETSFECHTKRFYVPVYVKDDFFVKEISPAFYAREIGDMESGAKEDSPYFFGGYIQRPAVKGVMHGLFGPDSGGDYKLKGYTRCKIFSDAPQVCENLGTYLDPSCRGLSMIKLFIQARIDWALQNNVTTLRSNIIEDNDESRRSIKRTDYVLNESKTETVNYGPNGEYQGTQLCYEMDLTNYKPTVSTARP